MNYYLNILVILFFACCVTVCFLVCHERVMCVFKRVLIAISSSIETAKLHVVLTGFIKGSCLTAWSNGDLT